MSHGASVLFLNGRFESSSFHAEHLTASNKYEFALKNKVISTWLNDHISVTEPVEVTGKAFCAANSFPTTDKCKFSGQENISCEFYEVKLGKQGFALRHKLLSEASDAFTATDKVLSEASDGLPASNKVLSEVSDGFTALDRAPSEASDGLPVLDRALSEASDGFTATDIALSEASDGLPALDKVQSEGSDGLPALDKVQSEGSDGLPATDKALSEGSDGFTAIESRDNVGFDRLNQRGDAIFSKFARVLYASQRACIADFVCLRVFFENSRMFGAQNKLVDNRRRERHKKISKEFL